MALNNSANDAFVKEIPVNKDNECVVLACAIKSVEHRRLLIRRVEFYQFRIDYAQAIFWAIQKLVQEGYEVTPDTILTRAKSAPVKIFPEFSDIENLVEKFDLMPVKEYEEIAINKLIEDHTKANLLKNTFDVVLKKLVDNTTTLGQIKDVYSELIKTIDKSALGVKNNYSTVSELTAQFLSEKERAIAKRTCGFDNLDKRLSEGLKEKTITIVCGRPGAGKSSFILSMLKNLGHMKIHTALHALEMHNMANMAKLISANSLVPLSEVVKQFSEMDEYTLECVKAEIALAQQNKFLHMQDTPYSLREIEDQICLLQDALNIEYIPVAIDLFGKIKDFRDSDNYARDFDKSLNYCIDMVKRLSIPLILAAQISREATKRTSYEKPKMQDLKHSGALEEAGDLILGMYRPNYDPEKVAKSNSAKGIGDDFVSQIMREKTEDPWDIAKSYKEKTVLTIKDFLAEVIIMKQRMGEVNVSEYFIFDLNTTAYRQMDDSFKDMYLAAERLEPVMC